MHEVLVNRLGGLTLPTKSVVRLTDWPNMTLDVYPGCKTTTTCFSYSSAADAMNYFVDRVITITGPVENASKAESLISDKMRKCFERDMQNYVSLHLFTITPLSFAVEPLP